MHRTTALFAVVVVMAIAAMAFAGSGLAFSGKSGDANCATGGGTASLPPGWQMNGVPTMPNFPSQAYSDQTSFHRCIPT
jgi:hypothetical protein